MQVNQQRVLQVTTPGTNYPSPECWVFELYARHDTAAQLECAVSCGLITFNDLPAIIFLELFCCCPVFSMEMARCLCVVDFAIIVFWIILLFGIFDGNGPVFVCGWFCSHFLELFCWFRWNAHSVVVFITVNDVPAIIFLNYFAVVR